jgi:hypothetical protein
VSLKGQENAKELSILGCATDGDNFADFSGSEALLGIYILMASVN